MKLAPTHRRREPDGCEHRDRLTSLWYSHAVASCRLGPVRRACFLRDRIDRKREPRMKTLPKAAEVAFAVALLLNMPVCGRADEPRGVQEPPMIFYLEAGGKKTPIELGKPFKLDALPSASTAILRAEPYRVFPYAGISFRYPRSFTFETDFKTKGVRIWSLEGPSYLIMVQEYPVLAITWRFAGMFSVD